MVCSTALGIQPAQGRLFAKGETDLTGPPPSPGSPPIPLPPVVILSHELWQAAFGGRAILGQTIEVNGLPREVIGIMPPGADVMDNRTEIWTPLGLNPGQPSEPRQPLPVSHRAAQGRRARRSRRKPS